MNIDIDITKLSPNDLDRMNEMTRDEFMLMKIIFGEIPDMQPGEKHMHVYPEDRCAENTAMADLLTILLGDLANEYEIERSIVLTNRLDWIIVRRLASPRS